MSTPPNLPDPLRLVVARSKETRCTARIRLSLEVSEGVNSIAFSGCPFERVPDTELCPKHLQKAAEDGDPNE